MNRIANYALTATAMILAVCMGCALVFFEIPTENKDMFNVLLGAVIGWAGAGINYHLGSSAGSAAKDRIYAQSVNGDAQPPS